MKIKNQNIIYFLRAVSFALVLGAMLIQPVLNSLGILDQFNIELASIDFDEDTNEQETQEEENTIEEIELQLNNLAYYSFQSKERIPIYGVLLTEWCFSLETYIPPPERRS